jgi:hypothetical protein
VLNLKPFGHPNPLSAPSSFSESFFSEAPARAIKSSFLGYGEVIVAPLMQATIHMIEHITAALAAVSKKLRWLGRVINVPLKIHW